MKKILALALVLSLQLVQWPLLQLKCRFFNTKEKILHAATDLVIPHRFTAG